jgi:hypothetical protein
LAGGDSFQVGVEGLGIRSEVKEIEEVKEVQERKAL